MKRFIFIVIVLLIIAGGAYKYIYQDHRDITSERPEFTIESKLLINEFVSDSESSSQKYLNKTLEIIGTVTGIEKDLILLDNSIVCYLLKPEDDTYVLNSKIIVKGRFIGYDDLMEEIKMDQTSIVK